MVEGGDGRGGCGVRGGEERRGRRADDSAGVICVGWLVRWGCCAVDGGFVVWEVGGGGREDLWGRGSGRGGGCGGGLARRVCGRGRLAGEEARFCLAEALLF